PTPSATSARCSAVVPLFTAIACLAPQKLANDCSNAGMNRPIDEIQVVSRHSWTYASSFPPRTGAAIGMDFGADMKDASEVVAPAPRHPPRWRGHLRLHPPRRPR